MYQFYNDFLVVLYISCVIDLRSNTPQTLATQFEGVTIDVRDCLLELLRGCLDPLVEDARIQYLVVPCSPSHVTPTVLNTNIFDVALRMNRFNSDSDGLSSIVCLTSKSAELGNLIFNSLRFQDLF
ncbi:hypothetical protein Tco_1177946 [Tanacetum coccineum]